MKGGWRYEFEDSSANAFWRNWEESDKEPEELDNKEEDEEDAEENEAEHIKDTNEAEHAGCDHQQERVLAGTVDGQGGMKASPCRSPSNAPLQGQLL